MKLDRSAAFVAARTAFAAYPSSIAMKMLVATAEGVSARSSRHVRAALASALQLSASCEHARAHDAQIAVGKAIVALALLLHAEGVAGDLG